jgi:hypothetical protein
MKTNGTPPNFQTLETNTAPHSRHWKNALAALLLLIAAPTAHATVLASETFDTTDANWTDRDAFEMTVAHSTFGNPGGSLHGSFAAQTILAFESDAFRADTSPLASGGAFSGDWYSTYGSFNYFNFSFYSEDVLPSAFVMRIGNGINTFLFNLTPQVGTVGSWSTISVSLDYSAGWVGGSATQFSNVFSNVSFIDLQVTRNSTNAQDYYVDNISLENFVAEASTVPEPQSLGLVLAGLFVLRLARKRARSQPRSA